MRIEKFESKDESGTRTPAVESPRPPAVKRVLDSTNTKAVRASAPTKEASLSPKAKRKILTKIATQHIPEMEQKIQNHPLGRTITEKCQKIKTENIITYAILLAIAIKYIENIEKISDPTVIGDGERIKEWECILSTCQEITAVYIRQPEELPAEIKPYQSVGPTMNALKMKRLLPPEISIVEGWPDSLARRYGLKWDPQQSE